jgi:hypothetical protein
VPNASSGGGGYQFEVVDATDHPEVRAELLEATHREVALPYVLSTTVR